MDAWASPWADDALQHDDTQGCDGTVSKPPNAGVLPHQAQREAPSASQNIFGTKLHDSSFDGPSVWEAGSSLFGVTSSAWATTVSLSVPQHGGDPPDWNNNQAQSSNVGLTSPPFHKSSSFRGELDAQPDIGSSTTDVAHQFSEDWSQQLQPDWDALVVTDLPTAGTLPTVNQVKFDSRAVQVPSVVNSREKVPPAKYKSSSGHSEDHFSPTCKEPKPNVDTGSSKNELVEDRGVQPGQQQDDDFGDFGDYAEEGEIEEIGFAPEPVHLHATPLSPLDFTIAGSLVSELYPVMQKPLPMPPVEDIISTTTARKAWYRISRDGTVGKHNSSGDDYIRVAWPKSKVRADVCEIVNRWIREGRFSVNGAMGGERSYGPMFGWGEGAGPTQQNSDSKGSRLSLPPGVGLRGRETQQGYHKSSASVPSWDLQVPDKPKDASTVVNFGWGSSMESKEESVPTTKNMNSTCAKLEQKLPSDLFFKHPNDTLPTASSALKSLATGDSVNADPTIPRSPTFQVCKASGATSTGKRDAASPHSRSGLGSLPLAVAPLPGLINPAEANRCGLLTLPPNSDGFGASAFLEKKQPTETPNKLDAHLSIQNGVSSPGLTLSENSGDQMFGTSKMKATTDHDEWGEMINSPTGFSTQERNTVTMQLPQNHTSTITGGLVEYIASHNPMHRRDSAPSLLPAIHDCSKSSGISTSETGPSGIINTVDWDLSVFEGPTVASPDLGASSGCKIKDARKTLPHEDQQVLDILDGLPDMGYMLR